MGVSWTQANRYAKWRTDKVNDQLKKESGLELPEVPAGGRIPLSPVLLFPLIACLQKLNGNMPLRPLSELSGWKKCRPTNGFIPGWSRTS